MDPLSITASAIALIGAAGKISTSLWGFVQSLRGADTRVSCLCDELTSLVRLLQAVERTLKECRAFDLALLEEDLCHQSELALADCQVTLNELSLLVDKIKSTARTKSFARRARVVADFAVHGTELEVFREKIHKCNWALQTMLHTITVSLSLKNHASQDLILVQLDKLKSSFTLALQASHGSRSGFSPSAGDRSDTRIARNLMNLAKAARSFHSTASSTASSLATNSIRPSHFGSDVAMSYNGDLSPSQYERLMDYLNDDSTPMPSQLNFDTTLLSGRSSVHGDPRPSERTDIDEADEDVEQEFERLFLTGLEEAARDRIKHQDYSKAIEFLKSALRQPRRSMPNVTKQHEMQKLIALSHFLQGNWKLAEPIVWKLSNSKSTMDHAVCTLLHALSIAYLSRYELDKALETCKQAVFGKHRLIKTQDIDDRDYDDTLGLLITIYGMTGDYIRAEIFRRRLPEGFRYRHCANETEYIATHPNFLGRLLGGDAPSIETNWQQSPTCHELEADFNDQAKAAFSPQSVWAANISHHEKCEVDTGKEIYKETAPEIEFEPAPSHPLPESRFRRQLTRILRTKGSRSGAPKATHTISRWITKRDAHGVKRSRSAEERSPGSRPGASFGRSASSASSSQQSYGGDTVIEGAEELDTIIATRTSDTSVGSPASPSPVDTSRGWHTDGDATIVASPVGSHCELDGSSCDPDLVKPATTPKKQSRRNHRTKSTRRSTSTRETLRRALSYLIPDKHSGEPDEPSSPITPALARNHFGFSLDGNRIWPFPRSGDYSESIDNTDIPSYAASEDQSNEPRFLAELEAPTPPGPRTTPGPRDAEIDAVLETIRDIGNAGDLEHPEGLSYPPRHELHRVVGMLRARRLWNLPEEERSESEATLALHYTPSRSNSLASDTSTFCENAFTCLQAPRPADMDDDLSKGRVETEEGLKEVGRSSDVMLKRTYSWTEGSELPYTRQPMSRHSTSRASFHENVARMLAPGISG